MTIHTIFTEQTDLARTYAQDGAFRSAARVLRNLAGMLEDHATMCDLPDDREIKRITRTHNELRSNR